MGLGYHGAVTTLCCQTTELAACVGWQVWWVHLIMTDYDPSITKSWRNKRWKGSLKTRVLQVEIESFMFPISQCHVCALNQPNSGSCTTHQLKLTIQHLTWLHLGPTLTSKLWSVLVRGWFHPVALNGHLQKAFLQIWASEPDCDALRFHWQRDGQSDVEILKFARVPFGLAPSPF